jgi:hypothetical protein
MEGDASLAQNGKPCQGNLLCLVGEAEQRKAVGTGCSVSPGTLPVC